MLCPVEGTIHDLIEPPKVSHKRKSDRDRGKERLDKEAIIQAANNYRLQQAERHRPTDPREPLKKTAGNNWIHVMCAVFTPEIKFSDAKALEVAEGVNNIPPHRYDQVCKICKKSEGGACISCHQCLATFHVGCAFMQNYHFGFDVTPVKGSRRDSVTVVSMDGETGSCVAAVWCNEHTIKTKFHRMSEPALDGSGLNALQIYVRNFKQADLTLTGTVRKANLVNQATKSIASATAASGVDADRRDSTVDSAPSTRASRNPRHASSAANAVSGESSTRGGATAIRPPSIDKKCLDCGTETSPWFWEVREPEALRAKRSGATPKTVTGHLRQSYSPVEGRFYQSLDAKTDTKALATAALAADDEVVQPATPTLYRCNKCRFKAERSPTPSRQPSRQKASSASNPPLLNGGSNRSPVSLPISSEQLPQTNRQLPWIEYGERCPWPMGT